jgi:hypothetical protein
VIEGSRALARGWCRCSVGWIVVTLKSSDVYAGYIHIVDTGVPMSDRDLVLRDPSRLDATSNVYVGMGYRDIFIPASLIDSVGTLAKPEDAHAFTRAGMPLFSQTVNDESWIASGSETSDATVAQTPSAARERQEG